LRSSLNFKAPASPTAKVKGVAGAKAAKGA